VRERIEEERKWHHEIDALQVKIQLNKEKREELGSESHLISTKLETVVRVMTAPVESVFLLPEVAEQLVLLLKNCDVIGELEVVGRRMGVVGSSPGLLRTIGGPAKGLNIREFYNPNGVQFSVEGKMMIADSCNH